MKYQFSDYENQWSIAPKENKALLGAKIILGVIVASAVLWILLMEMSLMR